jgi:non-ribosomal peptide synthetase component E (peptide arylation enzyme)
MSIRSSLAELLADPGCSSPAVLTTSPLIEVSYQALADQVDRLSGQLIGAGLKPGNCVAIVLPNSLLTESPVSIFVAAMLRRGSVVDGLLGVCSPPRHRGHKGCTE